MLQLIKLRNCCLISIALITFFTTVSYAQVSQSDVRASMEKLYLSNGPDYELYAMPTVEILEKVTIEDYERWYVRYYVDEGEYAYAYILIPLERDENSKFPVVICPHPTSEIGKDRVVGIYPGPAQTDKEQEGRENRMYPVHLVKRGFVTIAPDRAAYGERQLLEDGNYEVQQKAFQDYLSVKHPGFSLHGKNVFDLKIALDVVTSFEFTDRDNVGIIGHSLGAMDAIMAIAFDTRIKAAVVNSGGMVRFKPAWWDMNSEELKAYLKNPSKNQDNNMNFFLMMAAPRAVLYQFSPADSFDWTPNLIEGHRTVDSYYRTFDTSTEKTNFSFYIHGNGHDFTRESRELSYSWLEKHLKVKPKSSFDKIYNPEPIDIAGGYSQEFYRTGVAYPSGWTSWMVATAEQTGTNPNNNPRIGPPVANAPSLIFGSAASTGNFVYNYAGKLGIKNGKYSDLSIVFALNTMSVLPSDKIKVSFDAMVIRNLYNGYDNTLVNSLCLQYRIGEEGNFINLGETIRNGANQQKEGTEPVDLQNYTFELPEECNNKPVVQLRWITKYISGERGDSNLRPSFAIDNFNVSVINQSSSLDELNKPSSSKSVVFYPNPTNGIINIKLENIGDQQVDLQFFDLKGDVVYFTQCQVPKGDPTLAVNLKGKLPPGQYIVKVSGQEVAEVGKLHLN